MRYLVYLFIICAFKQVAIGQSQGVTNSQTKLRPNQLRWSPTDATLDSVYIIRADTSTGEPGWYLVTLSGGGGVQDTTLAGDVVGGLNSTFVRKINGVTVENITPQNREVLTYNGTQWTPDSIALEDLPQINASRVLGRGSTSSGAVTQLTPSNGVKISGNYIESDLTAGTGINISGTTTLTVSNSAPDQTVTISGATGTYPNFTVTPTAPGGSSGQVQYNNAGSFGALDSFTVSANPDRVGIGVPTPTARLDIQGSGATSATNALRVRNSSGTELISFKNDGKIGIGISSATNPTIDAVVGFADVATNANESGGLRLRSNATDGNTRIFKLGISHTGVGGSNQGYGYIQFGYWGGSMNNPIVLQPLGGQVSIGQLTGLSDFSLISKGEVGLRANDDVAGNTIGGRISFLSQSGNGKSAFIAQIKEGASYYSSNGLIFATASGADISSSTGTERLRISGNGNISIGNVTPLAGLHNAINTTASTPSMLLSGTGYSGGTSTTTKPTLLIEPTGTPSTGWSTSGTKLGVNAESGFTGRYLDIQLAGVSKFNIQADKINMSTSKTPSSATDTGTTGDICWDANYIYVCVGTNTWKRTAITTW